MADFGSRNMGFFGGSTSGGGGSSTGVNGLNGTTSIGLGGTLSGSTTILGDSGNYSLQFSDMLSFSANTKIGWYFQNVDTNRQITAYSNIGLNSLDLLNINLTNNQKTVFRVFYNSIKSIFYPDTNGLDTNFGININFDLKKTSLGDIDDAFTKTKLIVDDSSNLIFTQTFSGNNGFYISNNDALFGSLNTTSVYCYLGINYANSTIQTFDTVSTSNGFSLDFNNNIYKFGSYNTIGNYIEINDANNSVELLTSNLKFTGAGLETSTAPTGTIKYLVITLNGVTYNILCQKP